MSHLQYFHKNSNPSSHARITKTSAISSTWNEKMKSITCSACKRIFPTPTDWKAHKQCSKEHDIFECIECKVRLKSSLMSDHLARVHGVSINDQSNPSKGKVFFLSDFVWPASIFRIWYLLLKLIPKKVKAFSTRSNWTCLICNTSFKLKKQLIEHEKTQHQVTQQNTYSYRCKVCEKSFRRPYLLREHEQVHEKRILFRCDLCPAKYR